MKKTLKTITALTLTLLMAAITPMTDLAPREVTEPVAKAAEKADQPLYISEIKLGNAYTDKEADAAHGMLNEAEMAARLQKDGYTVLMDGDHYADLNAGVETPAAKPGSHVKKVLFGYKTTTDRDDAITDLAVMNMSGGYSVNDYNLLLQDQMESRIKPFMSNFVNALEEYRENLKKPKDSPNYIRADFMRRMMNKFTDDDTGDQPLGDLLRTKTKYEMSDEAYNLLSNHEKQNHADILTILMEGNSALLMTLENLVARATDSTDSTWIERLQKTSLSDLRDEVLEDNPNLTKSDVNAKLDKLYQDDAKRFLKKWPDLAEALKDTDAAEMILNDYDSNGMDEAVDELKALDVDTATASEVAEAQEEVVDQTMDAMEATDAGATLAVCDFLEESAYEFEDGEGSGSTLLDFFSRDASNFSGEKIRAIYPIVASLTPGQLAALDFITAKDLVTVGMNNSEGYQETEIPDIGKTSIYVDVNREIYKPGGVAVTDDARRKNHETTSYIENGLNGIQISGIVVSVLGMAAFAVTKWVLPKLKKTVEVSMELNALNPDNTVTKAETFLESQTRFSADTLNKLSVVIGAVTIALVVATIIYTVVDMLTRFDVDFTPIPLYMVDETDIIDYVDGEKILKQNCTAYYKVVTCIRVPGNYVKDQETFEILGDRSDINGDIGQQWLALYSVKNDAGTPILADSLLYRKGKGSVPDGYSTGIHEFGSTTAMDLNKRAYIFSDDAPVIHVYYKNETPAATLAATGTEAKEGEVPGVTGSILADESDTMKKGIAIGGGIGILLGVLLGALFMFLAGRKKYPGGSE